MESVRGFNELKKIKGHASVSASRVNPSIRFEVSFGMKANPSPFESIAAVVDEIHGRRSPTFVFPLRF